MTNKNDNSVRDATASFGAGILAFIIVKSLNFIPKNLSVLPQLKSKGYLSGFIDGLGNLRNLLSAAVGGTVAVSAYHLLSKENDEHNLNSYKNHLLTDEKSPMATKDNFPMYSERLKANRRDASEISNAR